MQMVEGGISQECRLALRHVGRVINAMDQNTLLLRDVVQVNNIIFPALDNLIEYFEVNTYRISSYVWYYVNLSITGDLLHDE